MLKNSAGGYQKKREQTSLKFMFKGLVHTNYETHIISLTVSLVVILIIKAGGDRVAASVCA